MSGSFQTQVNVQPAPAVAGDFASANPRFTVDAGPGGLVAGPNGVNVGLFAWATSPLDGDNAPAVVNNYGTGQVTGFVHREQQALIVNYLAAASQNVPAGFPVTLYNGGDFWVKNDGATQALVGQKAYANYANGKVTFAATGTPTTGGSATGTIAAGSFSVTGSVAGNIMTVTAVGSGTIYPGAVLSSAAASASVVSQLTPLLAGETAGGIGRYYVTVPEQTVASTTITGTYGTFTAVSALSGSFAVGDILSGAGGGGVSAGTFITALGTGTGGLGTYIVNLTQTVTSTTISATSNIETKWIAMSSAAAGELVKISDHALG